MIKVADGKYRIGDTKTLIFVRVSDLSVGVDKENSLPPVLLFVVPPPLRCLIHEIKRESSSLIPPHCIPERAERKREASLSFSLSLSLSLPLPHLLSRAIRVKGYTNFAFSSLPSSASIIHFLSSRTQILRKVIMVRVGGVSILATVHPLRSFTCSLTGYFHPLSHGRDNMPATLPGQARCV